MIRYSRIVVGTRFYHLLDNDEKLGNYPIYYMAHYRVGCEHLHL